jgi:hypothetical protein
MYSSQQQHTSKPQLDPQYSKKPHQDQGQDVSPPSFTFDPMPPTAMAASSSTGGNYNESRHHPNYYPRTQEQQHHRDGGDGFYEHLHQSQGQGQTQMRYQPNVTPIGVTAPSSTSLLREQHHHQDTLQGLF